MSCVFAMGRAMTLGESRRRATNVSLRKDLAARAKGLDLNFSRIAEEAQDQAVRAAAGERWLAENRDTIEMQNAWIERHDPPLRPVWLD